MKYTPFTWLAVALLGGSLAIACTGGAEDGLNFATSSGSGSGLGGASTSTSTGPRTGSGGGAGGEGGASTSSSPSGNPSGNTSTGGLGGASGAGGAGTCPSTGTCNLDADCAGECTLTAPGASACCDTMTNTCFISKTAACPASPATSSSTGVVASGSSSSGY